jgi:ribonuclease HI
MWVTCYADASWLPQERKGGWAYSLISDRGRYEKYGACPRWVTDNNTAEFSAIIAGIYRAVRRWDNVEGVSVYTDSICALAYLRFYPNGIPKTLRRDDYLAIREKLWKVIDDHGIKIKISHVRGHQNAKTVKAYMNNKVDAWSRRAR